MDVRGNCKTGCDEQGQTHGQTDKHTRTHFPSASFPGKAIQRDPIIIHVFPKEIVTERMWRGVDRGTIMSERLLEFILPIKYPKVTED